MKKLLILMMTALVLCGCTKGTEVAENPQGSEQENVDFTEFEDIEVEVSDFVETDETTPASENSTQTEKKVDDTTTSTPAKQPEQKPADATANKPGNTASQTAPAKQPVKKPAAKPAAETKQPQQKTEETKEPEKPFVPVGLEGKIICIDAGHGAFTETKDEKIAPASETTKPGYTNGTKGSVTTEDVVTLAVANALKAKLEENGATVLMTRTDANATMSNVERAEYANANNAQIVIKLHADGTKEGGSGMTMLIPGSQFIKDAQLLENSKKLGNAILKYATKETGAKNRGTYTDNQMSGFNWSKVPVVLFEMGFMTNKDDEAKLNNADYQNKIAEGILKGVMEYYR